MTILCPHCLDGNCYICRKIPARPWIPDELVKLEPHDFVNRPPHYNDHPSGIECIEITRHETFNIGNSIKYLWKRGKKNDIIQDMEKAIWYIKDEINKIKNERLGDKNA